MKFACIVKKLTMTRTIFWRNLYKGWPMVEELISWQISIFQEMMKSNIWLSTISLLTLVVSCRPTIVLLKPYHHFISMIHFCFVNTYWISFWRLFQYLVRCTRKHSILIYYIFLTLQNQLKNTGSVCRFDFLLSIFSAIL